MTAAELVPEAKPSVSSSPFEVKSWERSKYSDWHEEGSVLFETETDAIAAAHARQAFFQDWRDHPLFFSYWEWIRVVDRSGRVIFELNR